MSTNQNELLATHELLIARAMKFLDDATNKSHNIADYQQQHPYVIGEGYVVQTKTMVFWGEVSAVFLQELVLVNALRMNEHMVKPEAVKQAIIPRSAIDNCIKIDDYPTAYAAQALAGLENPSMATYTA